MRALIVLFTITLVMCAWDPYGLGDPTRDGKLRIFIWLGAPLLAFMWSKRIPGALGCLWVWNVWLWAWHGPDAYGFGTVVFPLLFVFTSAWLCTEAPAVVLGAIRLSFNLQVLLGLSQYLNIAPWAISSVTGDVVGSLGHTTLLGCFVAPLVPVALMRWTKTEAFFGLMLVICTGSTMAAAALGAALVVMFWKSIGIRLALATGLLGLSGVGLVAYHFPTSQFLSASGRWAVWSTAWDRIKERPLGWGPGSWEGLYPHWGLVGVNQGTWLTLHNDWLQLQFEGGWPSLVIAAFFVVAVVLTTRNAVKATIIAGLAVAACGNFVMHQPATALLFCLALFLPEPHEA